jgi:hypothetical protein
MTDPQMAEFEQFMKTQQLERQFGAQTEKSQMDLERIQLERENAPLEILKVLRAVHIEICAIRHAVERLKAKQ